MRTFAISDIHGHYDELMLLYKKLPINPKKDRMVFLGDYIDRGPKTKQVIEQLMQWKKDYPHWVVLQGNHEDMLLDALREGHPTYGDYYQWFNQGGQETKDSYMPKGRSQYEKSITSVQDIIPQEHLNFIASLPSFYEDDKYIYVHGGLRPGKAPWEVAPYDIMWIRDEFINSDYKWGKKVIYGHSVHRDFDPKKHLEPYVQTNKIGIDTAVCYPSNNKLTAVELPTEKFYFQESLNKKP